MPASPKYAVPVPLNIDASAHARYLTDVIVMDPVCNWTVPDPALVAPANSSDSFTAFNVTLPAFGIRTEVPMFEIRKCTDAMA